MSERAKRSGITEHEIVCPVCGGLPLPVWPSRCERCEWAGELADLVRSGRSRARQFPVGKFPIAMPFR